MGVLATKEHREQTYDVASLEVRCSEVEQRVIEVSSIDGGDHGASVVLESRDVGLTLCFRLRSGIV